MDCYCSVFLVVGGLICLKLWLDRQANKNCDGSLFSPDASPSLRSSRQENHFFIFDVSKDFALEPVLPTLQAKSIVVVRAGCISNGMKHVVVRAMTQEANDFLSSYRKDPSIQQELEALGVDLVRPCDSSALMF